MTNILRTYIGKAAAISALALLMVFSPVAISVSAPASQPGATLSASVVYAQGTGGTASGDSPISCYGASFWINFFTCTGREMIAVIGWAMISIGNLTLFIASGLFDTLVTNTIIEFGSTSGLLSTNVQNGITTTWTAFRNISNILIIGLFAFIAISIMLQSGEFGQKKMISRVLIVAILINFSLFFTKVIIDVSNYTATQFYYAGIGRPSQTAAGAAAAPRSIGNRLKEVTGTITLAQTYESISQVGETYNGVSAMIVYAVGTFALLVGAAGVLFYGAFILASRAILLIFLMITAALAFATYLLPDSYTSGKPGWGMWWRSLIDCAVLAPILMVFLWATLMVAESLRGVNQNGSLGNLLSHPTTNTQDIGLFFSYIVILGLLFTSFKVASGFSAGISGFNWSALAVALPTAFAGGRVASWVGQRASLGASRGLASAAGGITSQSRMASLGRGALYGASGALANLSQKRLNPMAMGGAQAMAKNLKGTGVGAKELIGKSRPPSLDSSLAQKSALKAIEDAKKKSLGTSGTPPQLPKPPDGAPPTAPQGAQTAEAIKSAASAGAVAQGKETAAALEKMGEQNRSALEKVGEQAAEGQRAVSEQLKSVAAGVKEGTSNVAEGLKGVEQASERAHIEQTKAISAANDNKELARRVGAEEEHDRSMRKGEERAIQENIASATANVQQSAHERSAHLEALREAVTMDNTAGSVQTTVSGEFSRSFEKPLPNVGNAPIIAKSGPAEIVMDNKPAKPMQYTATVHTEDLMKELRERRAKTLRAQLKVLQGGKDSGKDAA